MADDGSKSTKQKRTVKVTRRRLKATPADETIRERRHKLGVEQQSKKELSSHSNIFTAFWWGFTWPIRTIFGAIARVAAKLSKYRAVRIPFRILGHILFIPYLVNSWREVRLVTWPNRRQSFRLTYAVIVFSVIFGVIVAVVDYGLDKLFKELIIK